MKFDPMTGEPINEEAQGTPEVTETPVAPENPANQVVESVKSWISTMSTKQWFLPAMIGGGVGVIAIIAVVVAIVGGAFMSPVQKVTYAAGNTFKEAGILGDVFSSTMTAVANSKSTTYFMLGIEGQEMEMEVRNAGKDKQVWVKADITNYPELEGTLTLNKNELQAQAPILGDYVFFYDYTKEADGFIFENVDDEIVEALNKMLAQAYSGKTDDSKALKEMAKALQEWMDDIEIEEVEKDEFEINGRDVNCVGYEIVIDEDMIKEYMEIVCDAMVEYMEEQGLDEMEGYDDAIFDEAFEDMFDEIEGMPEMTFTVYVDSNMLAAIVIEAEDSDGKVKILFEGGDYRAQNITVKVDGQKVLQIKGERDGNEETAELIIYSGDEKITMMEYEYDKKSGDFEFAVLDYYGDAGLLLEGTIVANGNGVEITDGELNIDNMSADFAFSCKKGAKIEKLSGERFDLGNADEDDLEELVEDLQDELKDFMPSYGYPEVDYDDWY
ncbi:MAG: hypothetical protein E7283_09190 [Lachnospiraceae bacterium]|nr:hypothetical protein [Lachnospiraceae bacterium]